MSSLLSRFSFDNVTPIWTAVNLAALLKILFFAFCLLDVLAVDCKFEILELRILVVICLEISDLC